MRPSARYLSRTFVRMASYQKARIIPVLTKITELQPYLSQLLPKIQFIEIDPGKNDGDLKLLQESEIIIGDANRICPYLYDLDKAKWVQGTWAGVDLYMKYIDSSKPKPKFIITRFSGSVTFGCQMAEYVISRIVMRERNYVQQHENQSQKLWSWEGNIWNFRIIADLKIGILGFGVIGKEVARILKAFRAQVWVMVRALPKEDERLPFVDEYRTVDQLSEILSSCDYVCNVLPSTDGTRGLLGNGVLRHCSAEEGGKGAVFVNIGRGTIISEKDLLEALDKNWISGAILDVFETEPLPTESRLWGMPQVTISPHVSGVTRAIDVAELFAKNLKLYESGQLLELTFDIEKGY